MAASDHDDLNTVRPSAQRLFDSQKTMEHLLAVIFASVINSSIRKGC